MGRLDGQTCCSSGCGQPSLGLLPRRPPTQRCARQHGPSGRRGWPRRCTACATRRASSMGRRESSPAVKGRVGLFGLEVEGADQVANSRGKPGRRGPGLWPQPVTQDIVEAVCEMLTGYGVLERPIEERGCDVAPRMARRGSRCMASRVGAAGRQGAQVWRCRREPGPDGRVGFQRRAASAETASLPPSSWHSVTKWPCLVPTRPTVARAGLVRDRYLRAVRAARAWRSDHSPGRSCRDWSSRSGLVCVA